MLKGLSKLNEISRKLNCEYNLQRKLKTKNENLKNKKNNKKKRKTKTKNRSLFQLKFIKKKENQLRQIII